MAGKSVKQVAVWALCVVSVGFFVYALAGRRESGSTQSRPTEVSRWVQKADSGDLVAQNVALRKLTELKAPQAVSILLRKLKSENDGTRITAAEQLGVTQDAAAVEPLIGACDDPSPPVVVCSIRSLGQIGDPRALERLKKFIELKIHGREAAKAIARLRTPEAEAALIAALDSPDPEAVLAAIDGLATRGGEAAAGALRQRLGDPLRGLDAILLEGLLQVGQKPYPGLLAEPCNRALAQIEARLKAKKEGER